MLYELPSDPSGRKPVLKHTDTDHFYRVGATAVFISVPLSSKQVNKIEFVQRKPKFKKVVVPLEDHVQCRCEAVSRQPPRSSRPGTREQRRKDLGVSRAEGGVRTEAGKRGKSPPLV